MDASFNRDTQNFRLHWHQGTFEGRSGTRNGRTGVTSVVESRYVDEVAALLLALYNTTTLQSSSFTVFLSVFQICAGRYAGGDLRAADISIGPVPGPLLRTDWKPLDT